MDRVVELERRCADAWPALVDEPLGQWRLRAAGGFTGRANSALTTGDPGLPVPEALRVVADFAVRHSIGPAAHVVVGSLSEEGVAAAGWRVDVDHPGGAESLVLTGPLDAFATPKAGEVGVSAVPTSGWWELAAQDNPTPAQRHVLGSGDVVGFGSVVDGGAVVAAVRGAVVGDLLHVSRLAVRPEARRAGLARALMGALASWGLEHGATRCALQVASHNEPALRLYASLGCTEHHRYRYWKPAA
ncbi:ribosomal protein S18 acetylase RimI-like enzyme [Saccharothrix tamanrassetensis]|uniref:Ribosomal protein S18 acetylase RimI-like enzyme n=1 Tax=Saccharothrix tamanrassetensis TaxID=1051531 RepID=A0A841CIL8_9PSEU|nr:GNAT family N-acetyltransferase [Saccharothrix tamanrassetensis]MBB5956204.1 ribosomal protein S18 acetylase RimI-like enzyme [Saccharothrix tamanrassetensis]